MAVFAADPGIVWRLTLWCIIITAIPAILATMKQAIDQLVRGENLSGEQMRGAIRTIMTGKADDAAIGGFLTALTIKGETVAEVTAAAQVMRDLSRHVDLAGGDVLVDPVGTGGDGASLFNVSTASSVIACAAGVKIAKHGNIAASGASGSADILRAAGVLLELSPEQIGASIARCGFGFMYAPAYHAAMRHVAPVRRALGIRTVFNVLGPLSNPAGVRHQVLGVFSKAWLPAMVNVAKALGARHVIAVHAQNGLDEFSVTHANLVCELLPDGRIREYLIDPRDFGMIHDADTALKVENPAQSLSLIRSLFAGEGPAVGSDMLALNAAAIFLVGGVVTQWADGIALARTVMADGRAAERLAEIASVSRTLGGA